MKLILIILIFLIVFIFSFRNEIYWNERQILIANDGKEFDFFGSVIEIKGNICVIGAPYANISENQQQGKVYIFQNNGTFWNQYQILIANDGEENDYFGFDIAISNDEKYILIGSPYSKVENTPNQGKVYIYENNGTFYNLKQILIANDGEENKYFATSVSISNDSSFIVIGTPGAKIGNNTYQGKAYIFQNNGTFWNEYQTLTSNDGEEYDNFGTSISISNDSSFIVIGASDADVGNNISQGKVYIFQNNGTFWNQYQTLTSNDGEENDNFGSSFSISNDLILIGSPNANINNKIQQGKVYIFQNNGTFWNQYQILIASDGEENDQFGRSISISNDFILIGSPQARVGNNSEQGKAYIFQNNGTFYNQYQILVASDGKYDTEFGSSVSISNNFVIIGAPHSSVSNSSYQGKAYIFESTTIPQVDILNCSSLFSSFECYWNKINSSLNDIEYQINYQSEIQNWEVIQSPILNENVLYQIFNSSIYQDISGNVDYSIQIKACNYQTENCGNPSNQINLTTKIDSVKNLNFESYSNSIQLNWNYPNVPIINSIPKLNHYFLSYQIQDSNQSTNVSISNSSTSFQINNLESSTNYLISIYSCRNEECLEDDKGEITTIQVQTKQPNTSKSSSKSKTTTIALSIVIPIVVIVGIILTIIFIKRKKENRQISFEYSKFKDEN